MVLLWLALQSDLDKLRSDDVDVREAATRALIERGDARLVWPLFSDDDPEVASRAMLILDALKPYELIVDALFNGGARDNAMASELFHALHAEHLHPQWRRMVDSSLGRTPKPWTSGEVMRLFPLIFLDPRVNLDRVAPVDDIDAVVPDALNPAAPGYRLRAVEGALIIQPADHKNDEPVCVRLLRRLAASEPMADLASASRVSDLCDDALLAAFDANKDLTHALWRHGREVLACRLANRSKDSPASTRRAALELMSSGDWPRRALGAQALANAVDASKAEWVEAFKSDDPVVKYCAAFTLRHHGFPVDDDASAFTRLLDADEPETLRHALHAAFKLLRRVKMPFDRMLKVAATLKEDHFEVEFRKIADPRLRDALLDLLGKGVPHERVYALQIVPAFMDEATVAAVSALAKKEDHVDAQWEYVDYLAGYMPAAPVVDALQDFVVRIEGESGRRAAIVLGARGGQGVREFFEREAASEKVAARARALVGLCEYARANPAVKDEVLKTIDRLATDPDADLAQTARDRAEEIRRTVPVEGVRHSPGRAVG